VRDEAIPADNLLVSLARLFTIATSILLTLVGVMLFRIVHTEWQTYQATDAGLRAIAVAHKALIVAEKVSFERGPSNGVLGGGDRPDAAKHARLLRARATSDAAITALDASLATAPETVQTQIAVGAMRRARAQLAAGRAAVDRVAALPRARRTPEAVMGAVHAMFDVVPLVMDAATSLSRQAERTYPTFSESLVAARLAAELREYAGRLGSQFTFALTSGKPLTTDDEYAIAQLRGRIEELHALVVRLTASETDPRVVAAHRAMDERYFAADMAYVDGVERTSNRRRPYGIDTAQFAARYVPPMATIVDMRDVLLARAVENAEAAHARALQTLLSICAEGLLALIAIAVLFGIVRRRVVRPLVVTTKVITDIARGDLHTSVPRPRSNDEIGKMLEAVKTLRDNSVQKELLERERQHLIEELRLTSSTDYLTGLLNRRAFVEAALHDIANANRYGRAFAVVMFDIDRFKRVNDRYGHDAGDSVIAAVAAVAEREFRAGDLVCRYGGEEFAVLAPECALDDTRVLTERVRRAVEALDIALDDGVTLRVTASFGAVAVAGGAACDLDTIVRAADEALYRAKSDGRNCVVVGTIDATTPAQH